MNILNVVLRFIGSLLVGLGLAWWLGVSPSEGSNLAQIAMFAVGLTLVTVKLKE